MKFHQNLLQTSEYEVFKLSEFKDIPKKIGIYSWHCFINNFSQQNYYNNIYRKKKLQVVIKGKLKNNFVGNIDSTNLETTDIGGFTRNTRMLMQATYFFSPPLYIGIACGGKSTLYSRLNTHKRQLIKFMQNLKNKTGLTKKQLIKELRRKEESKLAIRLAFHLLEYKGKVNEDNLFVKVIPLTFSNEKDIENLETYLNRTFHPILGRR